MAIHGSLFSDYKENPASDPFLLQNKKLLKINMAYGQVWAKTGSMAIGAPAGAAGFTAYSLEIAGVDGQGGKNALRLLLAGLGFAGAGALAWRRRPELAAQAA
jgi:hypothetical protein